MASSKDGSKGGHGFIECSYPDLTVLELILNCCLQEPNPHHARCNKDGLIVPVVLEQVTRIASLTERPQVLASLQHSVLADRSKRLILDDSG